MKLPKQITIGGRGIVERSERQTRKKPRPVVATGQCSTGTP